MHMHLCLSGAVVADSIDRS